MRQQLVVHVADGRAGGQAGGGVALAAFGRDPQLGQAAFLFLQLGRPVDVFLGLPAGLADGLEIALLLDREALDRLAGRRYAVDDDLGPFRLDADHDNGGDVRVRAGADDGAEMQVQVLAELQAAIGVRNDQRALDVVRHRLAGGVRNVVDRQDQDVVADADAAVLAAPGVDGCSAEIKSHRSYHRFVLQF